VIGMPKRPTPHVRSGFLSKVAQWPVLVRMLVAQVASFGLLLVLSLLIPGFMRPPLWVWPLLQGLMAVTYSRRWAVGGGWLLFQFLLPWAFFWQLGAQVPGWLYPALILGLFLVFGGGLFTRVPLYHSNRAAWKALADLVPEGEGVSVVDLGAGFGGPLAHLARHRPRAQMVGVEASPLVWLVAWVRTWPVRSNCRIRLGSLWNVDLIDFNVVYAFLSPVPMPELWGKALAEMKPGAMLVSNTFPVPGVEPERVLPLTGRVDACLWVYRIPGAQESRTH